MIRILFAAAVLAASSVGAYAESEKECRDELQSEIDAAMKTTHRGTTVAQMMRMNVALAEAAVEVELIYDDEFRDVCDYYLRGFGLARKDAG